MMSDNIETRVLPGTFAANSLLTANRALVARVYIPTRQNLDTITYKVTTVGETGSVMRVSVYEDIMGWPGALITEATGPADALGAKEVDITNIVGGRFVFIALTPQLCPTTPPTLAMIGYSPFFTTLLSVDPGANATYWVLYVNSITGAMPILFPLSRGNQQLTSTFPWIAMRFAPTLQQDRTLIPDRSVVLAPTDAWEQTILEECSVYYDGTQWVMLYTGGMTQEAIGFATAPNIDGPWTKGGPIIGAPAAGVSRVGTCTENGNVGRSSILWENGTLYVYYSNGTVNLKVVSGPDPLHLGSPSTALTVVSPDTAVHNTCVLNDGGTYRMLYEKRDGAGRFVMGYATASSPTGPFTINTSPLPTLAVFRPGVSGVNTTIGGPWFTKTGSTYSVWYHCDIDRTGQTDIYRATSTDLVNWTPNIVAKVWRKDRREATQTADAFIVTDPATGTAYAFWEGVAGTGNPRIEGSIFRSNPVAMPVTP